MSALNLAISISEYGSISVAPEPVIQIGSLGQFSDWSRRRDQLNALRNLADDWDGLGSDAPQKGAIEIAEHLMRYFQYVLHEEPPARIVANGSGGIIFEWQLGEGTKECEIDSSGDISWYLNGEEIQLEIPKSQGDDLNEISVSSGHTIESLRDAQTIAA